MTKNQSNTIALIEKFKEAKGLTSDYQVAKRLQITAATISGWRNQARAMDDTIALQIAEELGLDPLAIMAHVRADRRQSPREVAVWKRYKNRAALSIAAVLIAAPLLLNSVPGNGYILC